MSGSIGISFLTGSPATPLATGPSPSSRAPLWKNHDFRNEPGGGSRETHVFGDPGGVGSAIRETGCVCESVDVAQTTGSAPRSTAAPVAPLTLGQLGAEVAVARAPGS